MPKISELFAQTTGAKVFSKMDLACAYHQVDLHPDSRHYTAFVSPIGTFQYKRMPFGLASAASVFQRVMQDMLAKIEGTLVFQDDVLIFAKDIEAHNKILDRVLEIFQTNGVHLKTEKCVFLKAEVEYLGHMLSEEGIKPRPGLVEAILAAQPPIDKSGVKSFLGLCEYYSRFIPNFATKIRPISNLLQKGEKFVWCDECTKTFDEIKEELSQSEALKPYDPSLPCCITVDASQVGLGGMLTQHHGTQEQTVAFVSRVLRETEKKYSVIEKELLACVWAIEKFRAYVWGCKFTLMTDHKPLVSILGGGAGNCCTPRIVRLTSKLLQYHFDIFHISGGKNNRADYLSRFPSNDEVIEYENCDDQDEDKEECLIATIDTPEMRVSTQEEWVKALEEDQVLQQVRTYVSTGWPREKNLSPVVQPYVKVADEISIEDGVLIRADKLIPPHMLRGKIIKQAHEGHLGSTFTKRRIRESFWWPRMDVEIEEHVKNCVTCLMADKTLRVVKPPLLPVECPNRPWVKIGIDIMGPYQCLPGGAKYVVVMIDYGSKWPELKLVREVNTKVIIEFMREIFLREGFPEEIVSDNGAQFVSHEFQDFIQGCGCKHFKSSLYHPQANELVERMNRVVGECIKWAVAGNHDIVRSLRTMLWFYRTTPHSSTKISPFELLRGRKAGTRYRPVWMGKWLKMCSNVEQLMEIARMNVSEAQVKQKRNFDSRNRVKENALKVGDVIRIKLARCVQKGKSKFGRPVKIEKMCGNAVRVSGGHWWNLSKVAKTSMINCPDLGED